MRRTCLWLFTTSRVRPNTWRLNDAVEFTFPQGVSIPARGYIIVASIDVANTARLNSFRSRNGISASVPVYGPFSGNLDNTTEPVELMRPDNPEPAGPPNFGLVPYILVERVRYADLPPWPIAADGFGPSLQRVNVGTYGNDPGNWVAAARTPGAAYGGGVAPVITTQPTNVSIVAFNSASFTVGASGANLSYQWRFNGNTVVGGTNATLTLTNVQPSQEGLYQALVLNPSGSVASSNALLRVFMPARIIAQPVSLVFSNGSTDEATYWPDVYKRDVCGERDEQHAVELSVALQRRHSRGRDEPHPGNQQRQPDPPGPLRRGRDRWRWRCAEHSRAADGRSPAFHHSAAAANLRARGRGCDVQRRSPGTTPFGYRWRRTGVQVIPFPGRAFTQFRTCKPTMPEPTP
jgi:hypothetical protein